MTTRIILNGKKAGLENVRGAIFGARADGPLEVRVTWEAGDTARLVAEAAHEGCTRLVAGGGDGTVNEVADAILSLPLEKRPEMAIFPLGTANDFATGCGIPVDLTAALRLAQSGAAVPVDAARANDRHFLNVASGGFGAEITANTPVQLKNFLGGGAYTVSGLVQALKFVPYPGTFTVPGQAIEGHVIVGAVCNGRLAGGGQPLAPAAMIDDGLLDMVALMQFPATELSEVIRAITDPGAENRYVKHFRADCAEWACETDFPFNLDGEPMNARRIRFELLPGALTLVVPEDCPMLSANQ